MVMLFSYSDVTMDRVWVVSHIFLGIGVFVTLGVTEKRDRVIWSRLVSKYKKSDQPRGSRGFSSYTR